MGLLCLIGQDLLQSERVGFDHNPIHQTASYERAVLIEGHLDAPQPTAECYYYILQDLDTVAAVMKQNGNLCESMVYAGYGRATTIGNPRGDFNRDGHVTPLDVNMFLAAGPLFPPLPTPDPVFDLDLDGDRDFVDFGLIQSGQAAAPQRVSTVGNPFAFTGRRLINYETEPDPNNGAGGDCDGEGSGVLLANDQLQFNRNRWYDLETSRWLTRDPKGYADGMSLYEYCKSNPTRNTDPMGTESFGSTEGLWGDIEHLNPSLFLKLALLQSQGVAFGWESDPWTEVLEDAIFYHPLIREVDHPGRIRLGTSTIEFSAADKLDQVFQRLEAGADKAFETLSKLNPHVHGLAFQILNVSLPFEEFERARAELLKGDSLLAGFSAAFGLGKLAMSTALISPYIADDAIMLSGRIGDSMFSLRVAGTQASPKIERFGAVIGKGTTLPYQRAALTAEQSSAGLAGILKSQRKLYHYAYSANAENILQAGLRPSKYSGKVFTTPAGDLSPLQAQIDLALPPNMGLRDALFELDVRSSASII